MNIEATTTAPSKYALAFVHKENVDEGILVRMSLTAPNQGTVRALDVGCVIEILDTSNRLMQRISGNLHPDAVNEFGESLFIGDIADTLNDAVTVTAGNLTDTEIVQLWADYQAANEPVYASAAPVLAYDNGHGVVEPSYSVDEKKAAIQQLADTKDYYGYLLSPYSGDYVLLDLLIKAAEQLNTPLVWEFHPDDVSPEQHNAQMQALGINSDYAHQYYARYDGIDPFYTGWNWQPVGGIQLAERCARNAIVATNGVENRHRVIAGVGFPINGRLRPRGGVPLNDAQLELLAQGRCNPVAEVRRNNATLRIFNDSLTCKITAGPLSLIAVNDVGVAIDADLVAICNEFIHAPTTDIPLLRTRLREKLQAYKTGEDAPIVDFSLKVGRDPQRPYDRVLVSVEVVHVGTIRQIVVSRFAVDKIGGTSRLVA